MSRYCRRTFFRCAAAAGLATLPARRALADPIGDVLGRLDAERLRKDLFCLCKSPLPVRKANLTLPGHAKSTLDETDEFLEQRLKQLGYSPWKENSRAQAYGFDAKKPRQHAYATPKPDAPWYDLFNVYAEKRGRQHPEEIILLLAHKDSQSWIDSPGAYDNAVGTATLLEYARVLKEYPNDRTIRVLWCNEEHCPWTSVTAAKAARARGDRLIAIINVDSLGGKSQAEIDAGKKTNVTLYTRPEGKRLADLVSKVNDQYRLGLTQRVVQRSHPGDDDGSFVNAGFPAAIVNVGSFPYADPNYHDLGDTPEKVDIANVHLAAKAILGAVLYVDQNGAP